MKGRFSNYLLLNNKIGYNMTVNSRVAVKKASARCIGIDADAGVGVCAGAAGEGVE